MTEIFWGGIHHRRNDPVIHDFTYPAYFISLKLDRDNSYREHWPLFAVNRSAIFSLFEKDFLKSKKGTLYQKINSLLSENGCAECEEITFYFIPRFLGYAFNPVSFFLCKRADQKGADERHRVIIAEVHNTFGETHAYVIKEISLDHQKMIATFQKSFYVSPFFDVSGEYQMTFEIAEKKIRVAINLHKDSKLIFESCLWGKGAPLNIRSLLSTLFKFPAVGLLTMLRIEWQALKLFERRGLKTVTPSSVVSSNPDYRKPTLFDKIRTFFVRLMRESPTKKAKSAPRKI